MFNVAAALRLIWLKPFLVLVRGDTNVMVLSLPDSGSVAASAYADDITFSVRESASLHRALDIFDEYDQISGFLMNLTKFHVLQLVE